MVRIRLRRVGRKKQPSYRIVVADQRSPRDGRYIEIIGHYNPRTQPDTIVVQEDRALYWLSVGAQPTESVQSLFRRTGTQSRFERLRQGEEMEALVAEAEAAAAEQQPVSPKTAYDPLSKAAKAQLKAQRMRAAGQEVPEPEPEPAPVAEAVAEEEPAAAEAEAPAEAEESADAE